MKKNVLSLSVMVAMSVLTSHVAFGEETLEQPVVYPADEVVVDNALAPVNPSQAYFNAVKHFDLGTFEKLMKARLNAKPDEKNLPDVSALEAKAEKTNKAFIEASDAYEDAKEALAAVAKDDVVALARAQQTVATTKEAFEKAEAANKAAELAHANGQAQVAAVEASKVNVAALEQAVEQARAAADAQKAKYMAARAEAEKMPDGENKKAALAQAEALNQALTPLAETLKQANQALEAGKDTQDRANAAISQAVVLEMGAAPDALQAVMEALAAIQTLETPIEHQAQLGVNYALVANAMNWDIPTKPGVYGRQHGMEYKSKGNDAAKLEQYKTEIGYVYAFEGQNASVGAQIEADFGRAKLENVADKTKMKSYGVKVFGTKQFVCGGYVQAGLGFSRVSLKNEEFGLNKHTNLVLAQLGLGHEFQVAQKFFVEPTVKLQYAHLGGVSYEDLGVQYKQDALKSLIARLDVKGGVNLDIGKVWANAYVGKDFMGKQKMTATLDRTILGMDALVQNVEFSNKKLAYGVGLGADFSIHQRVGIEAKAGLDMGRQRKAGFHFMVGGRYNF